MFLLCHQKNQWDNTHLLIPNIIKIELDLKSEDPILNLSLSFFVSDLANNIPSKEKESDRPASGTKGK